MATSEEVEAFLREFRVKMNVFQIVFVDARTKNTQALLKLEITPDARKKVIESLVLTDYCQGPLDDKLYGVASMWVFGKKVNKIDVYIKISMGRPNNEVICISFHEAEHPLTYPFINI